MFRLCNRCRMVPVMSLRRFSSVPSALPGFTEKSPNRNMGIMAAAGIAAMGAYYYMKSDEAKYNVDIGTSESGTSESEVRNRIKRAYGYVLGGLGITGVSAFAFYRAGLPAVIMRTNPWIFLGVSLATSIPLMIGTQVVDYRVDPTLKHVLWGSFHVSMAGGLSILGVAGGPLIAQAAMATGCVVGGMSLLASRASPGSLTKYEAPLGAGLGILVAVGLGNMIFPMPILYNVMLYGGLFVFSGLLLEDTARLLDDAEHASSFDPINEGLAIYLDTINIFQKMVLILMEMEKNKRRR